MSFSFDSGLADDISRIRQLINDTVSLGAKFTDEALTYYLELGGSVVEAAALAFDTLANRYAAIPDVQVGNKRMAGSQLSGLFAARATAMRTQAGDGSGVAAPYVAGISISEFVESYDDVDIPRVPFALLADSYRVTDSPEVD